MTLEELNALPANKAKEQFSICCGASRWVEKMISRIPFKNNEEIFYAAEKIWFSLEKQDWLEAFSHHPKIGDIESLRNKFTNTAKLAKSEQERMTAASDDILVQMAKGNQLYEERFGYIFIVCASGKSAEEMLTLLQTRFENDLETELLIAAEEQNKITRLRLEKLLD